MFLENILKEGRGGLIKLYEAIKKYARNHFRRSRSKKSFEKKLTLAD